MSVTALVGTAIATGVSAYQRHQEKKRQEKIDQYNKDLNDRNFTANQLQNSPAYQMQRMKDAGYNPLASGITPDFQSPTANTNTLNPQPMETSSVADAISSGVNAMIAEKAQDLQAEEIELQKKKLELEKNQVDFNQRKAQVDQVTDMWNNGLIEHTDENKAKLADYYRQRGFEMTVDSDGNIIAKDLADIANKKADKELKEAQKSKVLQETETEKSNTLIVQAQAKYADRKEQLRINQLTADVRNALHDSDIKVKQKEALDIANDIGRLDKAIRNLDYNFYRSGVDIANDPSVRAAVAQLCENHKGYWDDIMYKSFTDSVIDAETYNEYLEWSNDVRHTDKTIQQSRQVIQGVVDVAQSLSPRNWIMPKASPARPPLRQQVTESYDSYNNYRGSRRTLYTY